MESILESLKTNYSELKAIEPRTASIGQALTNLARAIAALENAAQEG